ncbi:MAG TPA: S4 domain-containing protein, partial [Candidatus Synoicihabitans sp.]|nr:S4 domain-containing protein [Candidatus Synoicihabitans sp.]
MEVAPLTPDDVQRLLASTAQLAPTRGKMPTPEPVRVQKYLADSGVCSRRAAEVLITAGEVYVNGKKAEIGQKVVPGQDKVTVEGSAVRARPQPRLTLIVNKPRGLVCSNEDPHNPETIFGLLPTELARMRFFCAGRLDKDSEGLVVLT